MNKRMIAALTTGVVAVSTALQAMPAYAESDYKIVRIMMNVPYSVFYNPAVYGTAQKPAMAAYGANNTSVFDALTTASPKAMDEDMFPAIYHESEGVISGVTVPVEVVAKDGGYYLDDGSRVTGQKRETVEELRNGSDYDYCVSSGVSSGYVKIGIYSDELSWQGPRSGDSISEFCETYGDRGYFVGQYTLAHPCKITASMEDGPDSEYKDVTIHIDSHGDDLGTVYGAVLVAEKCGDAGFYSREYYALRHLDEIWTSTEYGFDLEGEFAALAGKDIVQIFIYSSTGIHYEWLEQESDLKHSYGGSGFHVRKKSPVFEISTWETALTNWMNYLSGKVRIELNGLPDDIGGFDNNKSTVYYLDEQGNKVVIAETGDRTNEDNSDAGAIYVSTDKIQNGQTYYVDWESDKYASATSSNGLRFYNSALDDEDDRKQEESGGTDQGSTGGETSGDSGSGSTDTGKTEDGGNSGSGSDINTGKSDVNIDDAAGKTDSDDADNAGDSDEKETLHKSRGNGEDRHGTKYLSWVTVNAGTATTDGYMEYVCSECGKVKYRVPISAYYNFNKESESSVRNAAQGATVKVDTKLFVSFHKSIVDELKARPDVTLVVDYTYQGVDYEMTIPAGSGALMEQLFGQDQFAGFRYLAGAFATVER